MEFVKGLELNRRFFNEVIQPLIKVDYPDLKYSAGLFGYGSDVLGLDTSTSMDHNWGPRCILLVHEDHIEIIDEILSYFSNNIPFEFYEFPTNYTDPRYDFTQKMLLKKSYPINHLIEIYEFNDYFKKQLKVSDIDNIKNEEYLKFQDQVLLELTSGEVFYDGLKKLVDLRSKLKFYPPDVLKLKLASLYQSIWNEEPFLGRCIEVNDFIGIKLISGRIVNTYLKVLFYLEKKYIPYSKWFGSKLKELKSLAYLDGLIRKAVSENDFYQIESYICELGLEVIKIQNTIENFPIIDLKVEAFFGRPSRVIFTEKVVDTLLRSITDESLRTVNLNLVGLDIKLDSVDFTE